MSPALFPYIISDTHTHTFTEPLCAVFGLYLFRIYGK